MRNIWRSKRFLIGLSYIVLLLASSFIYTWYFKDKIPEPKPLLYNAQGELIGKAPFSPSTVPPFGTDRFNIPLLNKVIEGAKFTILIALFIGFARVMLSMIFGALLSLYTKRLKGPLKAFNQVFHYIPTIFIAFILIYPVDFKVETNESSVNLNMPLLIYQVIVITLIVVPSLSVYLSDEIDELMKKEFMMSSKLMGASRWHLISKHIRLQFKDRLALLFMQQIVQTLILLTHLGLLQLFIGGVQMKELFEKDKRPVSLSNEWSGLVGIHYFEVNLAPWVVLVPLGAFAVTIFFINLMASGMKDALDARPTVRVQAKKKEEKSTLSVKEQNAFTFANQEQSSRIS
ncbi:ABC transporter permease subunit [Microbacteriaceae bacterium 4G12]